MGQLEIHENVVTILNLSCSLGSQGVQNGVSPIASSGSLALGVWKVVR